MGCVIEYLRAPAIENGGFLSGRPDTSQGSKMNSPVILGVFAQKNKLFLPPNLDFSLLFFK